MHTLLASEDDYEVVSIFEVDTSGGVDKYSFSIVDEDKLVQVFTEFCRRHNPEETKDA